MSNPAKKVTDAALTEVDGVYDISISDDGDIESSEFFDSYILMALFCEQRASETEIPISRNRRGWIGNESTPGFQIGSKLWLFEQGRLTRSLLNSISSAAKIALEQMVVDGFAKSVNANAIVNNAGGVDLLITIERPNSAVETRNYKLWENTGK